MYILEGVYYMKQCYYHISLCLRYLHEGFCMFCRRFLKMTTRYSSLNIKIIAAAEIKLIKN